MSDPPPYGFRSDFLPPGVHQQPPQHISGMDLSYAHVPMPMPIPESPPPLPPAPQCPDVDEAFFNSRSSQSSDSSHSSDSSTSSDSSIFTPVGCCWQMLSSEDPFPTQQAVRAGRDQDGDAIFVGRAYHEGDMIPAKVIPNKHAAFISYDGKEVEKTDFEILRKGDLVWEFAANGEIPEGAVAIGRTSDGEKLYMGRCLHEGSQTPGKIHPTHGCLYIPFNGEELTFDEYEVLVVKENK